MVNPFKLDRSWLVVVVALTACAPMQQGTAVGEERVTMERVPFVQFRARTTSHFHRCTAINGNPRDTTVHIGAAGGLVRFSDAGNGPAHMLLVSPNPLLNHRFRMVELSGPRAGVNITSEPQLPKDNGIFTAILVLDGQRCDSLPNKFGVGKDVGGKPEMKPSIWDQNARIAWGYLNDLSAYAMGIP